jgi:hypothetical protein
MLTSLPFARVFGILRVLAQMGRGVFADVAERQTRMPQEHVPERAWRFKSSHLHHLAR